MVDPEAVSTEPAPTRRHVRLPRILRTAILSHAVRDAPRECCGVLIGREHGTGNASVDAVMAARNVTARDPACFFTVDPATLIAAHKRARATGRTVVGYYHAHPSSSARPSEEDRRHAVPRASYLIVALTEQTPVGLRSWRLDDDHRFQEERVIVSGSGDNEVSNR